jgi:hypothetical protein
MLCSQAAGLAAGAHLKLLARIVGQEGPRAGMKTEHAFAGIEEVAQHCADAGPPSV